MYHRESLVSFLCKNDIIKIGLNRKVTLCALFNQLSVQCSVCVIFNPPIAIDTCSKLPAAFALFCVLSLGYALVQLKWF